MACDRGSELLSWSVQPERHRRADGRVRGRESSPCRIQRPLNLVSPKACRAMLQSSQAHSVAAPLELQSLCLLGNCVRGAPMTFNYTGITAFLENSRTILMFKKGELASSPTSAHEPTTYSSPTLLANWRVGEQSRSLEVVAGGSKPDKCPFFIPQKKLARWRGAHKVMTRQRFTPRQPTSPIGEMAR